MKRVPFLLRNLHHGPALIDEGQTLHLLQVIIYSVPARAHAYLQHTSVGLCSKATSKTGNAPDIFCGGDIGVEAFGCAVVAICDICVLGRERVIGLRQKGLVEVEAICCEGIDG